MFLVLNNYVSVKKLIIINYGSDLIVHLQLMAMTLAPKSADSCITPHNCDLVGASWYYTAEAATKGYHHKDKNNFIIAQMFKI